ncbi:hypothetical protein SPHINGO8BC_70071 [Sphingobacterium multivorum]|uniref:Uncharacterized protein n=1 Tax=Sphingobacterium multivorum TaxID=28454 RepID=A0A654DQC8_SPHMU|nr:hypothetical protein SPHINGO8BC_70071 [Sphingobacterium multivorum]
MNAWPVSQHRLNAEAKKALHVILKQENVNKERKNYCLILLFSQAYNDKQIWYKCS